MWCRAIEAPGEHEQPSFFGSHARVASSSHTEEDGKDSWKQIHLWEAPQNTSSRFSGQHCLAAAQSSFDWEAGLKKGQWLIALGLRKSVRLFSLETGHVQAELLDLEHTCSCVWLSPDCTLLATAGSSSRIMVWRLPELALVHVFPAIGRVWALWGDDKIIASAGADGQVTVRSLETGASMMVLRRPGVVHVR